MLALQPETGAKLARSYQLPGGNPATRSLEYWSGDRQFSPELFFGTNTGKLIALECGEQANWYLGSVPKELSTWKPGALNGPDQLDVRTFFAADRLQERRHNRRTRTGDTEHRGCEATRGPGTYAHRKAVVGRFILCCLGRVSPQ